jgi:hypothetical protein
LVKHHGQSWYELRNLKSIRREFGESEERVMDKDKQAVFNPYPNPQGEESLVSGSVETV